MTPKSVLLLDGASREFAALLALLRLARGAVTPAEALDALSRVTDWPWLLNMVARHGVATTVHQELTGLGEGPAPPSFHGFLTELRRKRKIRGLAQLRELHILSQHMTARDIPILAFKGPLLSRALFGDVTHRAAQDIDVLVPPDRVSEVEEILLNIGYHRLHPRVPLSPGRTRLLRYRDCASAFRNDQVTIEVHWRLMENPRLLDIPFSHLFETAIQPLPNLPLAHPDGPDLLLYLAVHGAKHQWVNLKWLEDLAAFIETRGPQVVEEALARAVALGVAPVLLSALSLSETLLGTPPAPAPPPGVDQNRIDRLNDAALRSLVETSRRAGVQDRWVTAKIFLRQIYLRRDAPYLGRLCLRWLFNPADWERIPLPDALLPLYVLLRPILWLFPEKDGAKPSDERNL